MKAALRAPILAILLALALTAVGEAGQKTTHVKAYTKKDGTTVAAHERKAPEPKGATTTDRQEESRTTAAGRSRPPTSTIRVYTDPTTGIRTVTNAPEPTLPARSFSSSAGSMLAPVPTRVPRATPTRATTARRIAPRVVDRAGVVRNDHGRIQRSAAARHAFARQTGFPSGRPGYVIDHVVPLACGGVDAPSNMQWQTIAEGHLKDKTERVGCR